MHKGMGRSQVSRKAIPCVDAQPNLQIPLQTSQLSKIVFGQNGRKYLYQVGENECELFFHKTVQRYFKQKSILTQRS
jgi:hypothetical protein